MVVSGTHYSPTSSVQYAHYCNGTIPCIAEGMGETLYYIPYTFDSFIGPEQWWDNEEHLVSVNISILITSSLITSFSPFYIVRHAFNQNSPDPDDLINV